MANIGFYPGCSLKFGSREYKESVDTLAKAFGYTMIDVPDWSCCGASAGHNMGHELSLALPARIIALAEKAGMEEVVVVCACCYSRLSLTQHALHKDEKLKDRISEVIDMPVQGSLRVLNVIQFIQKYILDKLPEKIVHPFNYKVACYYGCLLVRPHGVLKFDRPEDPQMMDDVMRKIGADTIDWAFKVECCGAGMSVARTDIVGRLSGSILNDAVDRGAEAIIVACPMCQSNLDIRRKEINKAVGKEITIPVIYVTQAIGLAIGLSPKELGLHRHLVPVILPIRENSHNHMEKN